jgi:hypothetical protein
MTVHLPEPLQQAGLTPRRLSAGVSETTMQGRRDPMSLDAHPSTLRTQL